jgi:hypothetical protein
MHWAYASAFACSEAGDDPPAWTAVVVVPEAALWTVGDFDPPEQAATVTPKATTAAAHRCDKRIIPPCRQPGLGPSFPATDTPSAVSATSVVFDMAAICARS